MTPREFAQVFSSLFEGVEGKPPKSSVEAAESVYCSSSALLEFRKKLLGPLLGSPAPPVTSREATGWASANIALIKYWGKRDAALNLPTHGSLSLSLGSLGTRTKLSYCAEASVDTLRLNGAPVDPLHAIYRRLKAYLDLFRPSYGGYVIETENTLPTAAGLASSASSYASMALALNDLHGWRLERGPLSLLARLGSGSASRSLFPGFAIWHAGNRADGMDSFSEELESPSFRDLRWAVGLVSAAPKTTSSSEGMERAGRTSPLFERWVEDSCSMLVRAKEALARGSFSDLGELMERSCLLMHSVMLSSTPSLIYWTPQTLALLEWVRAQRSKGLECYATVDAGPNVKILYREATGPLLAHRLSETDVPWIWVDPFASCAPHP